MSEKKKVYIEDLPDGKGYKFIVPRDMKELTIGVSISGRPETRKTATLKLNFDPKVVKQYFTDRNDNELVDLKQGDKIYAVLETKNLTGETIDVDLTNKRVDFLYEGKRLEDDILKDYTINSDTEKIPLEVIPEIHEEY